VKAGVRAQLGFDQARWLLSAVAPIPPSVLDYFHVLGLPICEFWGCARLGHDPDTVTIRSTELVVEDISRRWDRLLCRVFSLYVAVEGDTS
jgi:hypothetical protein